MSSASNPARLPWAWQYRAASALASSIEASLAYQCSRTPCGVASSRQIRAAQAVTLSAMPAAASATRHPARRPREPIVPPLDSRQANESWLHALPEIAVPLRARAALWWRRVCRRKDEENYAAAARLRPRGLRHGRGARALCEPD